VIVALGIYPQLLLDRSEEATVSKVQKAGELADEGGEAEAAPASQQQVPQQQVPQQQVPQQQIPADPSQVPQQEAPAP
jgi:hypothetical protein